MHITVLRENTIHTKDYFEFLNSIPTSVIKTKNYNFFSSKNDIILNPNFIDLNYEKSNQEQDYLRCASIKFSFNSRVYIICGSSHSDCVSKIKDFFNAEIKNYQRGFLTNTNTFIRSEDVRSFIKNYKLNTSKIISLKEYNIKINDKFTVFDKDNNLLLQANILRKKITKNACSFVIKSKFLIEDKIKENIYRFWYVHLLKHELIISEKEKEFSFDKKLRINFLIVSRSPE